MPSTLWRIGVLIAAGTALVGGAFALENYAVERLLRDDAAIRATAWAEFLAAETNDATAIAGGQLPSTEATNFIERVKVVGRVFLYKVYDPKGRPKFASSSMASVPADPEDLADHNPRALAAAESGRPQVEVKTGVPPARPTFYSEAYVPVVAADGSVAAVVEAYIDQTAKHDQYQATLFVAAFAIAVLVALALGIPGVAWFWRARERDQAGERLRFLANYDALSRLANRNRLTEGLTRALAESGPSSTLLGVHCIDLDRFKDINDTFGLSAGDAVLRIVADRLRALAGPTDLVGRLAGDEFIIVQRAPRDHTAVSDLADKIIHAMSAPITLKGNDIMPSVSIGTALAPDHGRDADQLIRNAELALVKAKSEGRSRVSAYTPQLDAEMRSRLQLERAIDLALAENRFELHYQPLYGEPDETLAGFEALARLPDESGGYISPDQFIAAAERMGAIHRLGAWVLREACATAAAWPANLTVSVNLSVAQFGASSIAALVENALSATGLAPGRLLIEITESVLVEDSAAVLVELTRLKSLGVKIVMDDFGTGYSSLNYLWRFPFDKLKIDGSFMRAFDAPGAPAEKIVRTIIALGHTLGMRVCVEGIETARHAQYARALGCDEVQGFYFGRPAPATQIAAAVMGTFARQNAIGAADAEMPRARTG